MSRLYELQSLDPPNYPIIKDLFDHIDIKKDGIIDLTEWSKTFMTTHGPSNDNQTQMNFFSSSILDLGKPT